MPTLRRARLRPSCAQIDKLPLPVKSAPGFLVNRVLAPYMMDGDALRRRRRRARDASTRRRRRSACRWARSSSPTRWASTSASRSASMLAPDGERAAAELAEHVDAGQLGKKTGAGLLPLGGRQGREKPAPTRGAGRTSPTADRPAASPKRRRRSPKASSRTPTWSTPARSSAPASRRFAAGRCNMRGRSRHAMTRADRSILV